MPEKGRGRKPDRGAVMKRARTAEQVDLDRRRARVNYAIAALFVVMGILLFASLFIHHGR